MSTALAVPQHLASKGRADLIKHVMNVRQSMARHKETAKHVGRTMVGNVVAVAGGATAGVVAVKLPHLPKTRVRTDLALGAAVGVAVAAGVFDEHSEALASYAHGLLGFAIGDVVRSKMLAAGQKPFA